MVLKNEFFESLSAHDVAAAIADYSGSFLAIAGSEDYYASYAPVFAQSAAGKNTQSWVIEGGDHIYKVFSGDNTMSQSVIARTAEWFANSL
jgi:hypothetical protein